MCACIYRYIILSIIDPSFFLNCLYSTAKRRNNRLFAYYNNNNNNNKNITITSTLGSLHTGARRENCAHRTRPSTTPSTNDSPSGFRVTRTVRGGVGVRGRRRTGRRSSVRLTGGSVRFAVIVRVPFPTRSGEFLSTRIHITHTHFQTICIRFRLIFHTRLLLFVIGFRPFVHRSFIIHTTLKTGKIHDVRVHVEHDTLLHRIPVSR